MKKFYRRIISLFILYIINFLVSKEIVRYIFNDIKDSTYKIISLDVTTVFFSICILALYLLIIQTMPYFFYLYIKNRDALLIEERKIINWAMLTIPLGVIGSFFSFYIVKEMILPFFIEFNYFLGLEQTIGYSQIISLIVIQAIVFFLIFQIPLIIKFLTALKIIKKDILKKRNSRLTYLTIITILSSWLTPPDPISLLMVALPLYLCYEIGILIS